MIQVELIVREECDFCDRINRQLFQLNDNYPEMKLDIKNITEMQADRMTLGGITPSIWVNGKLWFLGSFDQEKFLTRMNALSDKSSDKSLD